MAPGLMLMSAGLGGGVTVTNALDQLCLDANEALQSEELQLDNCRL